MHQYGDNPCCSSQTHRPFSPDSLVEFAFGGISYLFHLQEKSLPPEIQDKGVCFWLGAFSSWDWADILWATRWRILVLLSESRSSGAHLQFASTSEYLLACELSILWMMVFFNSLYCANILAGGRHAAAKPFDPSESPTSCNLVFQLCKCYPHTYSFLLCSDLRCYFFISNSIIFPVSQCAASHFPKKKRDFSKWSLDGYTTAQDFTALLFQPFKPFLTAL